MLFRTLGVGIGPWARTRNTRYRFLLDPVWSVSVEEAKSGSAGFAAHDRRTVKTLGSALACQIQPQDPPQGRW